MNSAAVLLEPAILSISSATSEVGQTCSPVSSISHQSRGALTVLWPPCSMLPIYKRVSLPSRNLALSLPPLRPTVAPGFSIC